MNLVGLVTLGRDAEMRSTSTGTSVLSFSGAYNTGFGQNKETQWVKCTIFGKKAEALQSHLVKGTKVVINGNEPKVATYPKSDGTQGVSFECIVNDLEFAGSGQSNGQENGHSQGQQQPQSQTQQGYQGGQQNGQNNIPPAYQNNQPQRPQQNQQQPQNNFNGEDMDVPF